MNRNPLKTQYSLGNSTIPDYFTEDDFLSYSVSEVEDRFLTSYDEVSHPSKRLIISLLKATSSFLRKSSLDSIFKPVRDKNNTDEIIRKTLNDIALAVNNAIKEREQFSNKNGIINDSKIAVVLSHAINYCMTCVIKRMNELNSHKDRIYQVYESQENDLKKVILSAVQQPSLRPK